MRRDAWARLALMGLGTFVGGSIAGLGLANYTASGSFDFYRSASVEAWRSEPRISTPDAGDLAFGSPYRDTGGGDEPRPEYASFVD